jgi:hypothetical protein
LHCAPTHTHDFRNLPTQFAFHRWRRALESDTLI